MPPALPREDFLASRIADIPGYDLMPRCPGRDCPVTYYPTALLARRGHGALLLVEYISRLRCRHCGERPASVGITDDTSHLPPHGIQPWTWGVELLA